MRDRRRAPAGEVQAEKQQRYVQLIIAQGVNHCEACPAGRDQPQDGEPAAVWLAG
jgi:hypothetical protein